MVKVNFVMDDEDFYKLKKYCQEKDIPMSHFYRKGIKELLEKNEY